jgi:hypothetical protein
VQGSLLTGVEDQMVNRGDMRASDADHDVAAARLRGHYAAGRLTQEGFRRRGRRRLRFRSRLLLTLATVTALWLLIGFSLPHNGLLIAALLLMLGLMGLTAGVVVALVLLARRAWRRGAWLEGLPVLVGLPWLGRAMWAGRTVWVSRAAWRAERRYGPAYPASRDYPGSA